MSARSNFHYEKTVTDKHLAPIAKKPKIQARNNIAETSKPRPKSQVAEKRKIAEKRQAAREASAAPLRKERKRELFGDPDPQPAIVPPQKPVRPEFSKPELDRREECLQAIGHAVRPTRKEILDKALEKFEHQLVNGKVEVSDCFGTMRELTENTLEDLFYSTEDPERLIVPQKPFFTDIAEQLVCAKNKDLHLRRTFYPDRKKKGKKKASDVIVEDMATQAFIKGLKRKMMSEVPFERWMSFVAENKRYPFARAYADAMAAVSEHEARKYPIPEDRRSFILDIGPTNSGKTYSGIQRLIGAESGVYLGPLRLLAMEVAEEINDSGTPCTLLTGEEHRPVDGARHVASTVEMLDRSARYEVAVIDECQMITDPERGYAWAGAIASVNAEIIHLCLAPEAEELICNMLDGLGEDYEICRHERLVPLKSVKSIRYPKDIRQGDAIIVFSRRSVQEYASFLRSRGIKASMVYGALPYEVRREEVRKFMDGETKVVVATDAIGMGLNLPVKRVVFAEMEKFDGHQKRELTTSEIKQIAGRAGRFGQYDVGYATATDPRGADLVARALAAEETQHSEIRMDMPYQIVGFDYPLSILMRAWQRLDLLPPYVKRDLTQMIRLARRVEDLPNEFVVDAIEIPFKSGDKYIPLDDMWEDAVRVAFSGHEPHFVLYEVSQWDSLQYMEDAAKVADLAYGLAKRYGTPGDLERVDENRRLVSQAMIAKLGNAPAHKTCTWCGKKMPADDKHKMHSECYREYRAERGLSW